MGVVLLVATIAAITRDYTYNDNILVSDNKNNTVKNDEANNTPADEDVKDTTPPPEEKANEITPPATEESDNNPLQSETNNDTKNDTPTTENNANDKAPENNESDKTIVVTDNFVFTATPGDYYTAFARDAIRQYSVTNKLDVSEERIQQSAAILAYQAGSPFLEVGQVVTITANDIATLLGHTSNTTPPSVDGTQPAEDTSKAPSRVEYSYTAEAGDSYVLLARKAIDEYATSTNTALSPEQRIAAETFIINDAGFPQIDIGQTVTFSNDTIKDAVDRATSLSTTELANWAPYAALAGF